LGFYQAGLDIMSSTMFATLVVVGCICVVSLLLNVRMVRRLRQDRAPTGSGYAVVRPSLLAPGSRAPSVEGETTDGKGLQVGCGSTSIVAFLAAGCSTCHDEAPKLVEEARRHDGERSRVIAVINSERGAGDDLVQQLREVASVVLEGAGGPISRSFLVRAYPTFYRLNEEGVVEAGGFSVKAVSIAPMQGRASGGAVA
jgi:thiol-disulfide isomerase/thioredoxin